MTEGVKIPSIRQIFNREYSDKNLLAQLAGEKIVPEDKVRLSKVHLDGENDFGHEVNYTGDQTIHFPDGSERTYSDVVFIRSKEKPFLENIQKDGGKLVRNQQGAVVGIVIAGDQDGNAYVAPAWQLV